MPSEKARTRFTQTHIDWIKKRLIEAKYAAKSAEIELIRLSGNLL